MHTKLFSAYREWCETQYNFEFLYLKDSNKISENSSWNSESFLVDIFESELSYKLIMLFMLNT